MCVAVSECVWMCVAVSECVWMCVAVAVSECVWLCVALPGVFSLEASDVSVESRASDLNFFSGTCSVVWCVGVVYFLSVTHTDMTVLGKPG